MAEAEANPSLGGYDDDFVSEVEDELQCAICRLPLKDPILTKCVVTDFAETAFTVILQVEYHPLAFQNIPYFKLAPCRRG